MVWPRNKWRRGRDVPPRIADQIVNLDDATLDDWTTITRNTMLAREQIELLAQAVIRHKVSFDHECLPACVDDTITDLFETWNYSTTRMVLLTLIKDVVVVEDEDEETPGQSW